MTRGNVHVPQPIEVLHGGGVSLACDPDGQISAEQPHGLFAGDTRVLSTYRFQIGGRPWRLLGRSRPGHAAALWQFQNSVIRDPGGAVPAGSLLLSVHRRLNGVLHDDLRICSFLDRTVRPQLTLQMDADFADIFEVKGQSLPPRLRVQRVVDGRAMTLAYTRGDFSRATRIQFINDGPSPVFVGALVIFDLELQPGQQWTCCVDVAPQLDGHLLTFDGDPHAAEPSQADRAEHPRIRTSRLLQSAFERGRADLRALAVAQPSARPYVAAGVPWFLTLFGRDPLVAALMAGVAGSWSSRGALAALAPLQATRRDDWRDAEPGKLPHELRRGELARRGSIPHSPYYGTHDAPALYCLALWHAWRWTGDRGLLTDFLSTAIAALHWCDELGDRDDDGLQEYATRSSQGYYNQGWKDAGDAILTEDGQCAELPLATVELQGYLFAARMAMAELLTEVGAEVEAAQLRLAGFSLQRAVEERFWMDEARCYALALDGRKRQVRSIASNAGHLLWCGLPGPEHAATVAGRLLEPDMFSGWGLRTLSARHPAYNPLSYQRGSVWPHDTMLAAAGFWRYGLREQASRMIKALLEAAGAFEDDRLPELFCGLDRTSGLPVPYEEANSPQAWAAAAPILAAQLFLGIVADAARGRCFLSPWLPSWLPRLELHGIEVGDSHVSVTITGHGDRTTIESLDAGQLDIVKATVEAPLWGRPQRIYV
jgi:glycogen debranching enzyme